MRRIKVFGPIMLVVLGMTAFLGVTSASADRFVTDKYPATVEGFNTKSYYFTFGAKEVICNSFEIGTAELGTPMEAVTPQLGTSTTCFPSGSLKANGCKLTFHPGSGGNGTVEIGPAGCGPMVYYEGGCEKKIGPQSFAATYSNIGAGSTASVAVDVETFGGTYTNVNCGAGTFKSMNFHAGWSFKAKNEAGVQQALQVHDNELYMDPAQPRFAAGWYPAAVSGSLNSGTSDSFKFANFRNVQCTGTQYSGELSGTASELSLSATYSGCISSGGLPAEISMNSCRYVVNVLKVGSPYAGSVDVACSKEGDGIEGKVYASKANQEAGKTLCVYKVGPQTGLTGTTLETQGSVFERSVGASLSLTGMSSSTVSGAVLTCGKTPSTSSYTAGVTLSAL